MRLLRVGGSVSLVNMFVSRVISVSLMPSSGVTVILRISTEGAKGHQIKDSNLQLMTKLLSDYPLFRMDIFYSHFIFKDLIF